VSGINSANTWPGFSPDNLTTLVSVTNYNGKAAYLAVPRLRHNYLRLCVTISIGSGGKQTVDQNFNLPDLLYEMELQQKCFGGE
jgi:hypothetical protein